MEDIKTIQDLVAEIESLSERNAQAYSNDGMFIFAMKAGDLLALANMMPDTKENRDYLKGFAERMKRNA